MKIGRKVPPPGGNGKLPGGIPILRHHHDDGLNTDRAGKPATISDWANYSWNDSHKEFGAKNYSDHFGNSQRSSLSPTGGVKSTSPVTENHYKNGYENCTYSMTSNEDNNHDTKHINKHTDANHDTRKLHE